jgi:hypothetical protein
VLKHWADHAAELKAVPSANNQDGPGAVANAAPSPIATVVQQSSITVEASVPNCDIEVDGNFMGSTPSTLNLTPGKHQIVVKKNGYQDWSRSMMVVGGSVRLSAEMAKQPI